MTRDEFKQYVLGNPREVILALLTKYQRPVERHTSDGGFWFAVREEDTPSARFIPEKQNWCDHGNGQEGGDPFNLAGELYRLDSRKDFIEVQDRMADDLGRTIEDAPAPAKKAVKERKTVSLGLTPTMETFLAHYGLPWSSFERAGCIQSKPFLPDVGGTADAISYPYKNRKGETVWKYKSTARTEDKGKRVPCSEKGKGIRDCLFGDLAASKGRPLVFTGGEEKMLAVVEAGWCAVTASCGEGGGNKIPLEVAKWIAEVGPSEIIVAFDNDGAGDTGMPKAVTALRAGGITCPIRAVVWPESAGLKDDLNDVLKATGPKGLAAFLDTAVSMDEDEALDAQTALTDIGRGRRFAQMWRGKMVYHTTHGCWFQYDGKRWVRDEANIRTKQCAMATAKQLHKDAFSTKSRSKELEKFAEKSAEASKMKVMGDLGMAFPGMSRHADAFDTGGHEINLANGTLNLATGILRSHSPSDYMTKMCEAAHNSDATCPVFDKFLGEIMGGDAEMVAYILRAFGYALTTSMEEQCMFIFHGAGRNGKSTLLEAITGLMGSYAHSMSASTIIQDDRVSIGSNQAREDLVALVGVRCGWVTEPESNKKLAAALVKSATAGDMMQIRKNYGASFDWHPVTKIFLATNHRPTVPDNDDGIWRRLHYIPFEVQFTDANVDKKLAEKLRAERSGILNRLVQGYRDWVARKGLCPPARVLDATADYRTDSDPLGLFFAEEAVVDPNGVFEIGAAYLAYKKGCDEEGVKPMEKIGFGKALKARKFKKGKGAKGVRVWKGIRPMGHTADEAAMSSSQTGDAFEGSEDDGWQE